MNKTLEKINADLQSIADYVEPQPEQLERLAQSGQYTVGSVEEASKALQLYEAANRSLGEVLPTLSSTDIIDAYSQGGRLLRKYLSGYMFRNFNHAYLPLMVEAIKSDHENSYLFLMALRNDQGMASAPTIVLALGSRVTRTRENALGLVYELEIREAVPEVEKLTKDSVPRIANFATKCLYHLQGKSEP